MYNINFQQILNVCFLNPQSLNTFVFLIFNPCNAFRSVLTQNKHRNISKQCIVFSKATKLCRCFKILKIHFVNFFQIFYSYSFRDITCFVFGSFLTRFVWSTISVTNSFCKIICGVILVSKTLLKYVYFTFPHISHTSVLNLVDEHEYVRLIMNHCSMKN